MRWGGRLGCQHCRNQTNVNSAETSFNLANRPPVDEPHHSLPLIAADENTEKTQDKF